MARKRTMSKTRAVKIPVKMPIVYEHQPQWGSLVKRNLALAKARAEAIAAWSGPAGKSLGKAAAEAIQRELMERAREIDVFARRSAEASGEFAQQIGFPLDWQRAFRNFIRTYHLGPSRVEIGYYIVTGQSTVFEPSDLIYPCPNDGTGHYWSAAFANGKVSLYRYGRHEIEGSNFTGKIWVYLEALGQGVADIKPGGNVRLATGCLVYLWRPVEDDPYQKWMLVAQRSNGMAYPNVQTTTPGIVSLNRSLTRLDWQFTDARPGDVLEIQQGLDIEANRAEVQLGPGRSACAAGGKYGFLETPPPTLMLEYTYILKREALPHWPHWER